MNACAYAAPCRFTSRLDRRKTTLCGIGSGVVVSGEQQFGHAPQEVESIRRTRQWRKEGAVGNFRARTKKALRGGPTRDKRLVGRVAGAMAIGFLLSQIVFPSFAQTGDGVTPPDPSVGADVPLSYFGPMPSETLGMDQERLVGPLQLLRSGKLDEKKGTIELPLYRGQLRDGRSVWFILTDTTDQPNANALGLNHAAKLAYSDVGDAVREGHLEADTSITFDAGTVDFGPQRTIVPGAAPNFFPPKTARPGSVADAAYSPLVRLDNAGGHIYNAPMVAFDVKEDQIRFCKGGVDHSLVHDRVVRICPDGNGGGTATIDLTTIFSFAKPSQYMSTEASDPVVAALDAGTFAPALGDVQVGRDDSAFSAVERLFPIANGPTGKNNPQRQGLSSALADGLDPLSVIGGLPTVALDYSPLWDLNLAEWTPEAIRRGYRARVIDEFQLLELVSRGWITGPEGADFGSTGIVVNCPIVTRLL